MGALGRLEHKSSQYCCRKKKIRRTKVRWIRDRGKHALGNSSKIKKAWETKKNRNPKNMTGSSGNW